MSMHRIIIWPFLAVLAVGCTSAAAADAPPPKSNEKEKRAPAPSAKEGGAPQESKPPAAVGKEVLHFLETKINLKVSDMSPALSLSWQLRLADIPLKSRETQSVSAKLVSFELVDVTLAEALRHISTKSGCKYRIVKNDILMATPEEWTEIDAGKKTFEALEAKAARGGALEKGGG